MDPSGTYCMFLKLPLIKQNIQTNTSIVKNGYCVLCMPCTGYLDSSFPAVMQLTIEAYLGGWVISECAL